MTVNDPDYPHVTEVRETIDTAAEPAIVHRTVVRESNTGWWLATFVAVVAIAAVVFLVTRSPDRPDTQVQAAIDQARTQATLDAQNNMAAQSAAAQSAAAQTANVQQNLAQNAQAAQLAAQQDAANRTAQAAADAQSRAELAARQASLAAQQASQRTADQAVERGNRSAQAPTPAPSDASDTP